MKTAYFAIFFMLCAPLSFSKQLAITFDDAPLAGSHIMSGTDKTRNIIQHLRRNHIVDALFFVTSGNIVSEEDKRRLQAYSDAGFHLAHHSHSHLSANRVDANTYIEDFDTAHNALESFDNVINYHRFPYLHYGNSPQKRKTIESHLNHKGYKIGYVTVDNFDWYINSKLIRAQELGLTVDYEKLGQLYVDTLWEGILFYDGLAKKYLQRSPKHILLLHENEMAALYLDRLIKHIRKNGWEIISPQEAYQDPIASSYEPEVFNFNKQGRIAALIDSKSNSEIVLRHPSENTEFLDQRFEEYQVFQK